MEGNSSNFTVFRRELYTGPELVVYFACVLPAQILCVIIILALLVAKDIKWKMRVILINILVAESIFSLSRSANFLGFPIRQMFNISDSTSVPLCVM